MKSSQRARVKYIAKIPRALLISAGASRYLADKIKHHKTLTPELVNKSLRIYRTIQYRALKASGLNKNESRLRFNLPPTEISRVISKMEKNVTTICKINLVKEKRKKGEKEALKAIKKTLSRMGWTLQDIDVYVNQRKSVSYEQWQEYKKYNKKNGYTPFSTWKQDRDQERARKALFSERAAKGWRRRKK